MSYDYSRKNARRKANKQLRREVEARRNGVTVAQRAQAAATMHRIAGA